MVKAYRRDFGMDNRPIEFMDWVKKIEGRGFNGK